MDQNDTYLSTQQTSSGFSLIELSIALIIIGLLMGPFFTYLNLYYKEKAKRETLENLNTVSLSLAHYFRDNGHYPCPAPIDLGPSDSASGIESECDADGKGSVTSNGRCPDGICTVKGYDGIDQFQSLGDINQNIKIGAVPFRALGLPYNKTIDGHGNKITYAVTERYGTPDYKIHLGAISIVDASGQSIIEPPGSAQFILISHGEDGKGSFSQDGQQNAFLCDARDGQDFENCNMDGTFLSTGLATVQGPNYYDDQVFFKMFGNSLLWEVSPYNETNIYNATKGNVGIGTDNPKEKLDVSGNIRALGKLNVDQLCNSEGEDCFQPDLIGGSGMICENDADSMIGIKDAEPVCETFTIKDVGDIECPSGQYLRGFTTNGQALCELPSWRETQDTTTYVTP